MLSSCLPLNFQNEQLQLKYVRSLRFSCCMPYPSSHIGFNLPDHFGGGKSYGFMITFQLPRHSC